MRNVRHRHLPRDAPLTDSSTGPLAGLGTKVYLTDRLLVHAEGRVWVTLRYAAGLGYSWGRFESTQ